TDDPVTIRTQVGGIERKGNIDHISEVVDARRRTVEVRVRLENKDRKLRPNAFVEVVSTPLRATRQIRLPESAVVTEGSKSLVFVSVKPGRLEPVEVLTGRRRDGEVEISSGLPAGAQYVAKGALLL